MFPLRSTLINAVSCRAFSTETTVIRLPYKVTRTKSRQLPIYTDFVHGGQIVTVIRRIEGSEKALATELMRYFGEHIKITIRPASKNIVIAGNQKPRVAEFLKKLGF